MHQRFRETYRPSYDEHNEENLITSALPQFDLMDISYPDVIIPQYDEHICEMSDRMYNIA